jgi:hypothetical protein
VFISVTFCTCLYRLSSLILSSVFATSLTLYIHMYVFMYLNVCT